MLLFNTIYASPTGCLRMARIESVHAKLSLAYRESAGRAHWEFALDDGCRAVSVRASRGKAQGVLEALMDTVDPQRKLGRPQLPRWALLGSTGQKRAARPRETRVAS